jgi:predicted metal-binding membrane protein
VSLTRGVVRSTSSVVLVVCALIAWLLTFVSASGMSAGPGTMGRGFAGFLVLWTLMMTAMMLPSVSPVAAMYLRTLQTEPSQAVRAVRTGELVVGYLAAWTAYGVIAYALARVSGQLAEGSPDAAPWVGAGALVVAGIYQLTPLKDVCLAHCRSPIGFLLHFGGIKGRSKDLRVGFFHGGFCVGCCWGLMLVLIVVGVMNLVWMVVIAATVLVEKTWTHGKAFSIAVGVGLIGFAFFVPSHPGLLPGLHATMM